MWIKKYSQHLVAAKLLQEQGTWMELKWGNVTSNDPVVERLQHKTFQKEKTGKIRSWAEYFCSREPYFF